MLACSQQPSQEQKRKGAWKATHQAERLSQNGYCVTLFLDRMLDLHHSTYRKNIACYELPSLSLLTKLCIDLLIGCAIDVSTFVQ